MMSTSRPSKFLRAGRLMGQDDFGFQDEENEYNSTILMSRHLESGDAIVLNMPLTFQICISIVLGILIVIQLFLATSLVLQREKRVFEFAQPQALIVFLASSIVATAGCYLFVYINNITCAVRDPIIFLCISIMGATIASRAWRISSLMNNPLMKMGARSNRGGESNSPRLEMARLGLLQALSVLSRCSFRRMQQGGSQRTFRVQVSVGKMMFMTAILTLPQLIWQIVVLSIPYMRPTEELNVVVGSYEIGRRECVVEAPGAWPFWVSVLFAALPLCCAYLLNLRPKHELDQLPIAVDERSQLESSFWIFVQILLVAAPNFFMALTPNVKAYSGIALVLGLILPLCYHIVYLKLRSLDVTPNKRRSGNSVSGETEITSAAYANRLVEMYERIGQDEKCISMIDETLAVFIKSKRNALGIGPTSKNNEEVGAGFTKGDLKDINADDLKSIINLLHAKGRILIKIKGFVVGQKLCAQINIDTIAIYENCPAHSDLDAAIIFPVYSICGTQLKGGMIGQDDMRTLQRDVADRFAHEANVQAYHFARALAQQADIRAGLGGLEEALMLFEKMRSIYLPNVHPPLLTKTYAQDRCAQCFAYSAVWLMQLGKINAAVERCELVIVDIIPTYDKKDILGILNLFIPIIRVLKWHGRIERARKCFEEMPDNPEHRMGSVRRPMSLLLSLCSDDSVASSYDMENLESDIALVLDLDFPDVFDSVFTSTCWSIKSFIAELCLLLALKLEPSCSSRYALIQKGIRFSLIADERIRGEDRKIKHIIAYESHRNVYSTLLKLAESDAASNAGTMYGNAECLDSFESSSNGTGQNLAKRLAISSDSDTQNSMPGRKISFGRKSTRQMSDVSQSQVSTDTAEKITESPSVK